MHVHYSVEYFLFGSLEGEVGGLLDFASAR